MDFKNFLTIKFTAIIAWLLLAFSLILYIFSISYFQKEFKKNLKTVSINIVNTLLDSNEADVDFIRNVFKFKINNLSNQTILLFNDKQEIQFGNDNINSDLKLKLLKDLFKKESSYILKNDTVFFAFNYQYKNINYQIITLAIDIDGFSKIRFIKISLVSFFLLCFSITIILGKYFTKQTLVPIRKIITEVEQFTEVNLNERLKTGNGKDEISLLAITFNQLLDRLENSFRLQKSFVSNASHEFRTPLTVMKGQIEVLLLQPRTNETYLSTFKSLLDDINNQIDLINGLSNLANANARFPNIPSTPVSIIELLDECVSELFKNKKYKVVLNIEDLQDDENTMLIRGDQALLRSALMNVMDNACKFNTTPSCQVNLACNSEFIEITVIDQGLGINNDDLANIFESFYRSNNTRHIQGHGIGLSLVKKIVEYYKGKIIVSSEVGKGTIMSIFFPNINAKSDLKL